MKPHKLNCETLKHYLKHNKIQKNNIQFLYRVNTMLFEDMLKQIYDDLNMHCLNSLINNIIMLIKNDKSFLKNNIEYFSKEYRIDTNVLHVAIYALTIGIALKFDESKLINLGIAGLMHDIGLKYIDDEIVYKKDKLTPKEADMIQAHIHYSVQIAEHNHIHNPYIIDAVLHHHEREDGSGYPSGLHTRNINELASILAICDVFEALISKRPYREAHTYFEALELMIKDETMQQQFNQKYLKVFLKSFI